MNLYLALACLGVVTIGCASTDRRVERPLGPPVTSLIDTRGLTGAIGAPYGRGFNGEAFQFDGITSHNGYQYAAYWTQQAPPTSQPTTQAATRPATPDYFVSVARRKLPAGPWRVIDLRDSTMRHALNKAGRPWDVHNTVSLGIAPGDGSIHLAYDHHNHPLRYRYTKPGVATNPDAADWSADLFAPETSALDGTEAITGVCYPAFTAAPGGDMILTFRRGGSGDGAWWIHRYDADADAHAWQPGHPYDDGRNATYAGTTPPGTERCAYPNGWTFGPDGDLHVTYVYRENFGKGRGGNGSNHDILYAWSPDGGRSWNNDAGELMSDVDGDGRAVPKQFTLASPGTVIVPMPQTSSLMNEQSQAVDARGRVHALMWHRDPAKATPPDATWEPLESSYFHYWRAAAGDWRTNVVPGAVGTRPRLVFGPRDDLYAVYTVRASGEPGGLQYDRGELVIARATAASDWTDWTPIAMGIGPILGEPMIDVPRVASDGVLSVFYQETPTADGQATPLRVIDFALR